MTYEVLGYKTVEGDEQNTDPTVQGKAEKRELTVIYTTDDMVEVDRILANGGYVDESDVWTVAEGYREKAEFDPSVSTSSTLKKGDA